MQRAEAAGALLSSLNASLAGRAGEAPPHSLGVTLWALAKTQRVPQQGAQALVAALQVLAGWLAGRLTGLCGGGCLCVCVSVCACV